MQTCYRHPDRRAGVVCQRCDRPICPDCMHQASVGFHCPECTRSGSQKVLRPSQLVTRPMVTIVLVALNATVFIWDWFTPTSLILEGGLIGESPFPELGSVAEGEWWRIITSGFLHSDDFIFHVLFNCLLLWQLGHLLEPALGRLRFGLLYACALIGGSLGVLIVSPDSLTVGASGAVFGLMGAALAAFRSRGIGFFDTSLGGLVLINLVFTFAVPNISVGGHVGGLIAGFVAGWIFTDGGPRYVRNPVLPMVAVGALTAGMFAGCLLVV